MGGISGDGPLNHVEPCLWVLNESPSHFFLPTPLAARRKVNSEKLLFWRLLVGGVDRAIQCEHQEGI